MVAAASARVRPVIPTPTPPAPVVEHRRPTVVWVAIGIAVVLAVTFFWQVGGANVFRTEATIRGAAAIGRVSLEPDPIGSRIDLVVVDRTGTETTVAGSLDVSLREPDGTVWKFSRSVGPSDFQPLPDGGLLAGRLGYSILVPASDWARAPRRGGSATVSVTVTPNDGARFATVAEERFP